MISIAEAVRTHGPIAPIPCPVAPAYTYLPCGDDEGPSSHGEREFFFPTGYRLKMGTVRLPLAGGYWAQKPTQRPTTAGAVGLTAGHSAALAITFGMAFSMLTVMHNQVGVKRDRPMRGRRCVPAATKRRLCCKEGKEDNVHDEVQ